jgi:hypothetical protein
MLEYSTSESILIVLPLKYVLTPELSEGVLRTRRKTVAYHTAGRSSLSGPRITILITSSGKGRCSAFASSHGARNVPFHIGRAIQPASLRITCGSRARANQKPSRVTMRELKASQFTGF